MGLDRVGWGQSHLRTSLKASYQRPALPPFNVKRSDSLSTHKLQL